MSGCRHWSQRNGHFYYCFHQSSLARIFVKLADIKGVLFFPGMNQNVAPSLQLQEEGGLLRYWDAMTPQSLVSTSCLVVFVRWSALQRSVDLQSSGWSLMPQFETNFHPEVPATASLIPYKRSCLIQICAQPCYMRLLVRVGLKWRTKRLLLGLD